MADCPCGLEQAPSAKVIEFDAAPKGRLRSYMSGMVADGRRMAGPVSAELRTASRKSTYEALTDGSGAHPEETT